MNASKEQNEYIALLKKRISTATVGNVKTAFQISSEVAQLLTSLGEHQEALPFYEKSITSLRDLKDDFIWKKLYATTAHMYATTLDYLGKIDEAEALFTELMNYDSSGMHVGDYAIFLHKRKRNYVLAQQ